VSPAARILLAAILVFLPMIAAQWWVPAGFPMLGRQLLLGFWGVGASVAAQRYLVSASWRGARESIGFLPTRWRMVIAALAVSLPMWAFLPLYARARGLPVGLDTGWPWILLGVVLVNGLAEEAIHRGLVFGNLRRDRSFLRAATISAAVFAAQHLYLLATMGWTVGAASIVLAALLAFPFAFAFERGGRSLSAPAILHTSSNAPAVVFTLPADFVAGALLPHMGVVLASLYLLFALRPLSNGGNARRLPSADRLPG
jgi:membrane protease YdiL (CAAX protease family)